MEQILNEEQLAPVTSTEGFVRVIAGAGTPEEICKSERSKTGVYLKRYMENQSLGI